MMTPNENTGDVGGVPVSEQITLQANLTASPDVAEKCGSATAGAANSLCAAPDLHQAEQFLNRLCPDWSATFQTFDDDKALRRGKFADWHHGTLTTLAAKLTALNDQGAGVFAMVNEGDGQGRSAKNVTRIRAVFVDLDGAPLEPVLLCPLRPHMVVESSPGRFHAYWITSDLPLSAFRNIQKAIAKRFEGDKSVHDLCRVMRLPGFVHRKGKPFVTRIMQEHWNEAPPYSQDAICAALTVQAVLSPAPSKSTPTTITVVAAPASPSVVTLSQCEIDEIKSALDCIKDWDERDRWREVGMALHSTGAGQRAFDLWTDWSKQSVRYVAADQIKEWGNFKPMPAGVGIGIGTIYKLAFDNGWQRPSVVGVDVSAIVEQARQSVVPAFAQPYIEVSGPVEVKETPVAPIPGVLAQVEAYYNDTAIVQQPRLAGAASIALGAAALGRLYIARARNDSYPSLYLSQVIGTGGGKEYARKVVEKFLVAADLDSLIGPNGYTSAAGVHSTLVDQPSHFVWSDEFGRSLQAAKMSGNSFQQEVNSELMKIWGALDSPYRYRGYATTTLSDNQKATCRKVVHAPAITLLTASTPGAFYDAVGAAGVMDGFVNRLLFFFGDDTAVGDAFSDKADDIPLPTDVIAWLKKVRDREGNLWSLTPHDKRPAPVILTFDAQAKAVMRDFQSDIESRKAEAEKDGFKELWVRSVEKAIRLALIAAISDEKNEIRRIHAEWAVSRALTSDGAIAKAAAGNIADTNHGKLCNDVVRVLEKSADGMAPGSLSSKCRSFREAPPRMRNDVLATLLMDRRIAKLQVVGKNGHISEHIAAVRK